MPRQQVYGKRSRAVFDAKAAFSSPEQPSTHPVKPKETKPAAVKKIVLKEVAEKPKDAEGVRRSALGEIQANAVVLPLEAVGAIQPPKSRSNRKRNDDMTHGRSKPKQSIDGDGRIPNHGRHTFFEHKTVSNGRHTFFEDEEPIATEEAPPPKPTEAVPLSELRRSPRKVKKTRKMEELEEQASRQEPPIEASDHASIPQPDDCPYHQHCAPLLQLSAHPLIDFATWSEQLSEHFAVTKIAEASFGEVYRLSLLDHIEEFHSADESVFKVIPLQAPPSTLPPDKRRRAAALRRSEAMSAPGDVANEVRLLQRMSSIPGFTNFRDVRILQGRPPPAFAAAFHAWNAAQAARQKDGSHFPDPSRRDAYAASQLWAVIEMQDAGTDLERLVDAAACTAVFPVWDIFWQTVLALAKGEESAEFEHRDLHLGNICVRDLASSLSLSSSSSPVDCARKLGFTPLETTIIDYTISRCRMGPPADQIVATDLADPSQGALFEGDSSEDYQYDIYRYMRGALYFDAPLTEDVHALSAAELWERTGRSWEQFHPQTNLVWLHFVLWMLLEQLEWPSEKVRGKKRGKGRKKKTVVEEVSAEEVRRLEREVELEGVLLKVQDLLDPNAMCANGIRSASDLVGFAVGEGWLDVEDVVGEGVEESALISQLEGLEI